MLHRFLILSLLGGSATALAAGETRRLKDDDLRELLEEAKKDVERFTDAIDSQYRNARITTATSEVAIDGYLKDLRKSAETMRDRFKDDYAAGREVLAFLRQASAIEKRAGSGGGLFGAEKEWPRLRGTLASLSQEYGIDWTSDPDGWTAQRMNDRALREAIETFSRSAESSFKKSLESALQHVTNVAAADRKAVLSTVGRLSDVSDDLKDAVEDGRDAAGELGLLKTSMGAIQSFLDKYGLSSAVGSTFRSLSTEFSGIQAAFH